MLFTMPTDASSRLIAVALLGFAAVVAIYFLHAAQARSLRVPDTVETFGAFELVTRGNALAGTDYALRYRGAPFEFVGKSGMFGDKTARYKTFNAMFTFAPGTPAILVNVGDPNNASFFYLLRDVDGKAEAHYVGDASGEVSAQWIDPPAAGITNLWDAQRHRGRLTGGRWLLVGKYAALDMQTLTVYPLARSMKTSDPSISEAKPVIAMAPDMRSFVRLGYTSFPENAATLVVFGLKDSTWSTVPIRRRVERFNTWADIDLAWINYYYQWQSRAGHPDRLIARPNAKPLPYHGDRRVSQLDPDNREYHLTGVAGTMRETLLAYLVQVEGGTRLPDPPGGSASIAVSGKTVHLTTHNEDLILWIEKGADSALVGQIGNRFDAVLATGAHDALFYQ